MRTWFRIVARAEAGVADLYIFDTIGLDWWTGEGITAKALIDELAALPADVALIRLHLNSRGGDVFEAVAITNALKQHRARVEVSIEALAASAATIVAMAGDVIRIADNGLVMVHDPIAGIVGTAADMRAGADLLDRIRDAIVTTYRWHSPLSAEAIGALMAATTWMDPAEAIANGFADEITEPVEVAACLDAHVLAKLPPVPERYRLKVAAFTRASAPPAPAPPAPTPRPEPVLDRATLRTILAEATTAGFPQVAATLLAEDGVTLESARARLAEAREIRGLCTVAKLERLSASYIEGRVPIATVKAQLTTLTALFAGADIDTSLMPDGQPGERGFSALDYYKQRDEAEAARRVAGAGAGGAR